MRWRSTRSTSRSASLSHTDQPALFSGDTLVYPGHDYLVNNLRFTLDRETDNDVARRICVGSEDWNEVRGICTSREYRKLWHHMA